MDRLVRQVVIALVAVSGAGVGPAAAQSDDIQLDRVPYLSQSEALCGGAAVAMIFRYWGDRRADDQRFAPLVDKQKGGIAQDVLVDAVRQLGWQAVPVGGSIDALRDHLLRQQPLILLIEDRPGRYHYVVAVGLDDEHVVLHDPTWGPSRRVTRARFLRAWRPTRFWALLITPAPHTVQAVDEVSAPLPPSSPSRCDLLFNAALDEIAARGLDAAPEAFEHVRRSCPHDARPAGELAAVSFAARRWDESAALAREATTLDASNTYAWDVLGASRFMQGEVSEALAAWNHIQKPRLDSVRVEGLSRTRYSLVTQLVGMAPNAVITEGRYRLAERRLQEMPGWSRARLGLRPDADGFAVVDVVVTEKPARPSGAVQWGAAAAHAFVTREASGSIGAPGGEGAVWSASWRWWSERPRVAVQFAAPRAGGFGGIWKVDGAWEAETYRIDASRDGQVREERLRGGLAFVNWLTPDVRFEIGGGLDVWNSERKTASLGGAIERQWFNGRVTVSGGGRTWRGLDRTPSFHSGRIAAALQSSSGARVLAYRASVFAEGVSTHAPLALWPGAGGGQARPALLRAHPLLSDGVIDGDAFGRRLTGTSFEVERWLPRAGLVEIAVASFLDGARADRRLLTDALRPRVHWDLGIGLRARVAGGERVLRIDYARGLRDGAHAITAGMAVAIGGR